MAGNASSSPTDARPAVQVKISDQQACIANAVVSVTFDLRAGQYSAVNRKDGSLGFRNAWYRVGEGGWKEPELRCSAEHRGSVSDDFGDGETLRVWYRPESQYDPARFLDITVYADQPFFVIGWGVENDKSYTVRVQQAEVLVNGELFADQEPLEPKVLRGGAGGTQNFVEDTWQINAVNSAMLTYRDRLGDFCRRTLVAGGLHYREFIRRVEFHPVAHKGRTPPGAERREPAPTSYVSLTVEDPIGKRIAPGEVWESADTFFVDIVSPDPFESLERFGAALATANQASPNPYDFPTLCGWMTSDDVLGDNIPINTSAKLVDQMRIAEEIGLTKYTPVAVRVEPDYYCYNNGGDTQQGWYDDEHWARYGTLVEPYETFKKFSDKVAEYGGKVFTYVQTSMPSNDFALEHPEWMLNNDISMLYEHRRHARTKVRYDYSDPGFQEYMRKMWARLGRDGVIGMKFDYPEGGWNREGGFEDDSYTTISAYRMIYQLCRSGLGPGGFIHERIGEGPHKNVSPSDATVGIVDLQRVWADASHYEPEMTSKIGLRWYKSNVAMRYYPDGKSFFPGGKSATAEHRRTFLTLVGLISGRLELGTGFQRFTDEILHDLTRLFPVLPNGKAFRPVDFLLDREHPEVYVYAVEEAWAQVVLVNNKQDGRGIPKAHVISAPLSGDQADTGSLGLPREYKYHVFDFWAQTPLGILRGDQHLGLSLNNGEARVYSVRRVEDHPQVIGTNRHVMCGMMELHQVEWDGAANVLRFGADLIGGEAMVITLATPEGGDWVPESVGSETADVTFSQDGMYVSIEARAESNVRSAIEIRFAGS